MNRFASSLAIAISILALVLAILPLARRKNDAVPAETTAASGSPAAPAAASGAAPAAASGLSNSEAATIAAEIVAKREREIVDRIWPKVARMRERSGLKIPPKPSKLDDVLAILLDFDGEEGADDGRSPEVKRDVTHCKNDLKQLGIYFCLFESKYRYYPGSIDDLKRPDLITADSTILNCPFDKSGDACSYEYMHPVRGDEESPDMIMAYDRHLHPDGKRCVLYFQGRVEEVADADFQKALAEQVANDRANLGDEVVKARAFAMDPALTGPQKEAAMRRLNILEGLQR